MNKVQSVLLDLIKQSQFGIKEPICFADIDIDELYCEAKQQTVLSLIAAEIPDELSNTKWFQAKLRQKAAYIKYCSFQNDLKVILDSEGIPFVILKGNSSAIYYSDPTLRSMGDVDFLVPQDMYEKTKSVLASYGYKEDHDNGRHAAFKKDNQLFEVHHHFSHGIDIEDYLISGLNEREFVEIEGYEFPILPTMANGLVLLDHFRRHLLYSVGLRQVIDWMMYVYRNLDDEFWNNEFGPVAKEKGIDKLAITLTRMCQIYLGLPDTINWCKSDDDSTCLLLLKSIFDSGNFGNKKGVGKKFERINLRIKNIGVFRWLQELGEKNWQAYHKCHLLKPFCWLYQLIRFIKKGLISRRGINSIYKDFSSSNERYILLKQLNLSDYL